MLCVCVWEGGWQVCCVCVCFGEQVGECELSQFIINYTFDDDKFLITVEDKIIVSNSVPQNGRHTIKKTGGEWYAVL